MSSGSTYPGVPETRFGLDRLDFGGNGETGGEQARALSEGTHHLSSAFPLSPAQLGIWYAQHVDPQVPINQAHELQGRNEAVKRPCRLVVLHGAKHGGPEFTDAERCDLMAGFLKEALK